MTSTHSRSHRRLARFVDWIKPDPSTRPIIKKQAVDIRDAIKGQAAQDGLIVIATPDSGSFAKHTGLRRHMRGGAEIEGQDIDLPFVVRPTTTDGDRINELLARFERYAKSSYPATLRAVTGSSVELRFANTNLAYDLVPMLGTAHSDHQLLLKKNGDRRMTSVAMHTDFVKRRTASSEALPGRVVFNECVRLMKWWRYICLEAGGSISEVRTILIELLCAAAYDQAGVASTYTETLLRWFSWLANVTAQRSTVRFNDYQSIEPLNKGGKSNHLWSVIDPVNTNNNVVHSDWGNIQLQEFAEWFAQARDALGRIVAQEHSGSVGTIDELLVQLFGSAILTQGDIS